MYNYNEMIKMGFVTRIDTCGCCCAEDYNDYDICGFSEYSWKIQ